MSATQYSIVGPHDGGTDRVDRIGGWLPIEGVDREPRREPATLATTGTIGDDEP